MNLFECLAMYQSELKTGGLKAALEFLKGAVDPGLWTDIMCSFDNYGNPYHTIPKDENGDGGFPFIFENDGDYVMDPNF